MKLAHNVREGLVYCVEQQREVDVLRCYGCDKLVRIDLDSRRPTVVCRITPSGDGPKD